MQDDLGGWGQFLDPLSEAPMVLVVMLFLFLIGRYVFKDFAEILKKHSLETQEGTARILRETASELLRETARILREVDKKEKHDDDSP